MKDHPHHPTRKQMREIRSDIEKSNIAGIPEQLRAMKKLWDPKTQRGLIERREDEAKLFESGMNCNCWA